MYVQVEKPKKNKSRAVANYFVQRKNKGKSDFNSVAERTLSSLTQMKCIQRVADGSSVFSKIATDLGTNSFYSKPRMGTKYTGTPQDLAEFIAGTSTNKTLSDLSLTKETDVVSKIDDGNYYCAANRKLPVGDNKKREFYGYKNPDKASSVGQQIMIKGLNNLPFVNAKIATDKGVGKSLSDLNVGESATYLQDHGKFTCKRNPSDNNLSWSDCIMGHAGNGASGHFNSTGHKQDKSTNQSWNKDPNSYQGPENSSTSSGTGATSDKYLTPLEEKNSHADWT
jgi:hypothetical protein